MNYFYAYVPPLDEAIMAAWDSQLAEAAVSPSLAQALAAQSADLFPSFAACYTQLRDLPRGARRALQRRLARSVGSTIAAESRRKLAGSLAGAALLLALGQSAAQANQILVTTNIPAVQADGLCSLIEAIQNANDTTGTPPQADCAAGDPAGADEIVLPAASSHTLSAINNSTYGYTGLPVITSQITITGNGGTIKRKSKKTPRFRIFAVNATGDLTLDNVTLSGGGDSSLNGGGVLNSQGIVTITNSTISGNTGDFGGGIHNDGGDLAVSDSTIDRNKARYGGGVSSDNGLLTVINSTISKNKAARANGQGGLGGGVFSYATAANVPTNISGSVITENTARFGGGVAAANSGSQSSLTIDNSEISRNRASRLGGGIANPTNSTVVVTNSDLTENSAKYGGGLFNNDSATIAQCTVSGNKAQGARYSGGGGLGSIYGTLDVDNSTISGNRAVVGGGVVLLYAYMTLTTSTITSNNASLAGGGVAVRGYLTEINSIISGNHAPRGNNRFYF